MHAKRVPSRVQLWCARGTLPRHDDPRFAARGFLPGQCPATPSTRGEEREGEGGGFERRSRRVLGGCAPQLLSAANFENHSSCCRCREVTRFGCASTILLVKIFSTSRVIQTNP